LVALPGLRRHDCLRAHRRSRAALLSLMSRERRTEAAALALCELRRSAAAKLV
jgi:hypothetical protein